MDDIFRALTPVVLVAALAAYFALMAAIPAALLWVAYHMIRDHWTVAETWRQARARLSRPR